jgi:hypothetical protein
MMKAGIEALHLADPIPLKQRSFLHMLATKCEEIPDGVSVIPSS